MQRYIVGFCVIVSALFLFPWWMTLLLAIYGALRFPYFIEAVVAGLIIDSLYGTHEVFGIPGFATITACVIMLSMGFLRRHIRYETFSS